MKKSILKLAGTKVLTTAQKKEINGGAPKDWDKCCLKPDSPPLPPYGCESWIICGTDFNP